MHRKRVNVHRKRATWHGSKAAFSHFQALNNLEHELKEAYKTLKRHAKPNINMYTFARDTHRVMNLLAEMRYLINECKIAQQAEMRKKAGKNIKSKKRAA